MPPAQPTFVGCIANSCGLGTLRHPSFGQRPHTALVGRQIQG